MLTRDEDDRPVLFMGGHRGYLISSPEHLDELQHFFGWGSNNGHLSKIIFVSGLVVLALVGGSMTLSGQ